jgi:hypothetical protein
MPIIPALRKLREEILTFEASLGNTARPCLKNKKTSQKWWLIPGRIKVHVQPGQKVREIPYLNQ